MRRPSELLSVGLVVLVGCASTAPLQQTLPTLQPTDFATVVDTPAPVPTSLAPTDVPPTVAPPTVSPTPESTAAPAQTVTASAAEPLNQSVDQATDAAVLNPCDVTMRPDPLPAPGSANAQNFFRLFRLPLERAPLYDPPGPKHVGLQAGHWLNDEVPAELGRLQGGAVGGGRQEWQVNLDVAQRAAVLLEANGIQVDVLPATVPPRYEANAFIAIHADGDTTGATRGFKVARPGFSSIPEIDDRLVDALNQTYGADTELPRDDEHISLRMRYYYAFNSRRYCHAVAPGVPQAIVELAYLTNATDRQYLIGDPDRLARGIADSVQTFLNGLS